MKPFICALVLCLGSISLHAQATAAEEAAAGVKALLQRMFSMAINEEELQELTKEANKVGVPRQQIIEAKLVWGLRQQNTKFLSQILPEVEILASSFDPNSAAAMPNAEAVKGFAAYIKALIAAEAKDEAGFKKNVLEAIWLNPQQVSVFTQAIEKFQLEAKMASLTVDLKIPVTTSMGEATTLHDQLQGKKAILIDFWASFCVPCLQLMPAMKRKSELLAPHGIVVVAMNKDEENAEGIAERFRKELDTNIPWLVEPAERPYTKILEVDTMPRMTLITSEGKILFNGHPEDPDLWIALKKIDASIERPTAN
ncbi:TlpA disulfide reductase family protein [Prosthecobacter sp.]|uniref:TlpA family protein disulfide reductase n=1 Tax=Prosthecobacter sp. TaxID=1965333 RepID=UPI001D73D67C|nr:TlpA disulfide reductase family protein [Prosthecobacter sp.]MCB1278713.1 redoxin family protein [Prosthecobacter sp.]